MPLKLTIVLIIIAVVIAGGGFFLLQNSSTDSEDVSVDDSDETKTAIIFEEFTTETIAQFLGTPIVVNSWATWCPFCIDELPGFAEVQRELGDKVVIIAVNRSESMKQAKKFTDRIDVTDDLIFMMDPDDTFFRSLQSGNAMPQTIFIDSSGARKDHKIGDMDADEIRDRINKILN